MNETVIITAFPYIKSKGVPLDHSILWISMNVSGYLSALGILFRGL